MAGVVLETLSNRKLGILGGILLLSQIACFLLGGLIAPKPSAVQPILATKCLDVGKHRHKGAWLWSRGENKCESVGDLDDPVIQEKGITANQVVFTFQVPLPKENVHLDMSRWFQNLIGILQADIVYNSKTPLEENPVMTMDARLGYRDKGDPISNWTEIARSSEERLLKCKVQKVCGRDSSAAMLAAKRWAGVTPEEDDGYPLDCEMMPLFELGSCHYDYYLINIRLPVHELKGMNMNIGAIKDMWLVLIWQNGGFTKVWFSLKTVFFPLLLTALIWFWKRIAQLDRPPMLLEKTLFALGLALSFLNLPVEWLTLRFNMPFMLLLSDIRQGIFYAFLLSFWIIFAGEHMMDQIERNQLVIYWKHLSAVVFGCLCLFVFEMCERGVQLTNPFYSIWVTDTGTNLALAFIILAGISACLYFVFLCYMVFKVFKNISAKKSALPHMSKAKRKYYSGLIFRFKFLMSGTLLSAAITVIFFIISQVSEGHWKWGEDHNLEYTSAFFTGVYGMWNLYVIALLSLYAPSHKRKPLHDTDDSNEEVVEFSTIPTEASRLTVQEATSSVVDTDVSVLTAFAKKAAAD